IEAAANAEELDKIGPTFATSPEKEKNLLEKRLASRSESLREKARVARIEADLAKKAEMARKAEEEARRLSAGDDYRGALAFVNKDGNDPAAVGRVKSALNSIYFRNLDSVAREDAGMEDLAYLLGHKNALNVSGESALAQLKGALKKKLGAEGAELADELDTPVGSLIQLEDIEGKLTQYDEVVAGLAEAPFRLSVSPEISRKLEKGRQRLREYRRALDTGARAGSFEIVASQPNSLNLRGRSWTSAFRKNDNVSVYFPNGQSASSDNESFSAEERGSEFVLNLGPFVLEKMYGEATLKTSGDGETRSCSWSLSVGANELFAMLNNGVARIPAGGSCKGLVLEFKK
ncbi:MAG: hypothetical protein K2H64_09465, partial [Desulfovibrio sp.]|nr:hypothetical protein [Desulfovibrio sp.]